MFNFYIPKQSSNYNSTISRTLSNHWDVDVLKDNNQAKKKGKKTIIFHG
jgi:hypothetical protein